MRDAIRLAWERLKKETGVIDRRFLDPRYEATSRFFEMGLSVPKVAPINGHRGLRALFRNTHFSAQNVTKKLSQKTS